MTFTSTTYANFVAEDSSARERLFLTYLGSRDDFDFIIIGSGMGGGILADDLADRVGKQKRILVLEAGSFLYPTHVYNVCRFPNASVARHFACDNFWQWNNTNPNAEYYIHEKPQLNVGGRSIFWSGLIPTIQPWELDFFPTDVRNDLVAKYLKLGGERLNESSTMGETAEKVVDKLRQTSLATDFEIRETPRALHQPYLADGHQAASEFFVEPTGVFNTAELLINQLGLTPGVSHGDGVGLHMQTNQFVEDIKRRGDGRLEVVSRNTLSGEARYFHAGTVVMACGSIESPKLLQRSSLYHTLSQDIQPLVGQGITDHPTTDWIGGLATEIDGVPIPRDSHAKVVFYSRGLRDGASQIKFPFNVEMNINHEYWHLRDNDPSAPAVPISSTGASIVEVKFSFGNCIEETNRVQPAPPFGYVPEMTFKNLKWTTHLTGSRFPKLAGWQKSDTEVWSLLNNLADRIFGAFRKDAAVAKPDDKLGQNNKGFGNGTVHHAVGTLSMPYRTHLDGAFNITSVVDEDLQVQGTGNLFACDMSVLPFSSAANPVRTLSALALRLSEKLA